MSKKKTHEEFVNELEKVNKNIQLLDKYANNKTKVLCKCLIDNYEWYATPANLLRGHGCPMCSGNVKKTQEEFVNEVKKVAPYIDILGEYINRKSDILIKDNRCGHEYMSNPERIYRGRNCPYCTIHKKKTHEDFEKEVYDMYGEEYTVISTYKNAKTPIKLRHNVCGYIFDIRPTNFLQGRQCPIHKNERISRSNILPLEVVKNKIFDLVGDEYSIDNYTMVTEKATFTHKTCGTKFNMLVSDFTSNGQRCSNPKCVNQRFALKMRKSPYQFKKEFDELVDGEYELLSDYIKANKKVKILHKKCGNVYEATPNSFFNGTRCPICRCSKGELKIRNFLDEQNIFYEYQKRFDNLVGINNWKLSYDFYIPNKNILIEYQGEQHEHSVECFGGDKTFKRQKEHDKRKREYAKTHNIKLLEIWYYDFKNIETILEKELNIEECVTA